MQRRTAAANKAIRLAWKREQKLVQEGKGTREWTKEQQEDILNPDKGKAYDSNGLAYEGQHMKSVGKYPQYQGDPDNIQFLTKEEHLEAHLGNWQKPTNWYYNPITHEIIDFGSGPFIPCKVINLKDPIIIVSNQNNLSISNKKKALEEEAAANYKKLKDISNIYKNPKETDPTLLETRDSSVLKKIKGFAIRHKGKLFKIGSFFVALGGSIKISYEILRDFTGNSSDNDYDNYNDSDDSTTRLSPREHDVSGYTRKQNGKDVKVRPYKRGGKK